MLTIQAKPITHENFAPFGQFYPMSAPEGYALDCTVVDLPEEQQFEIVV